MSAAVFNSYLQQCGAECVSDDWMSWAENLLQGEKLGSPDLSKPGRGMKLPNLKRMITRILNAALLQK